MTIVTFETIAFHVQRASEGFIGTIKTVVLTVTDEIFWNAEVVHTLPFFR